MKKILRLTGHKGLLENESKFKESAQKIEDIDIDFLCYLDLFYDIDGQFKYIATQEPLSEYDYFWIGGIRGLPFKNSFIYHYGHLLKKRIIDSRVLSTLDLSKLSQITLLKYLDIPVPKSLFFTNDKTLINEKINIIAERFTFPLIIKDPVLDRGEGVFLIKNITELKHHLQNIDPASCSLVQEFIENNGDYRVIATKKGIVGTIKRYNNKDFRNNVSIGGTTETIYNLPQGVINATAKILDKYGLDIAGIDFFLKRDSFYVIEINDLPQYAGFEKTTGISYTEEVLKYIKNL